MSTTTTFHYVVRKVGSVRRSPGAQAMAWHLHRVRNLGLSVRCSFRDMPRHSTSLGLPSFGPGAISATSSMSTRTFELNHKAKPPQGRSDPDRCDKPETSSAWRVPCSPLIWSSWSCCYNLHPLQTTALLNPLGCRSRRIDQALQSYPETCTRIRS